MSEQRAKDALYVQLQKAVNAVLNEQMPKCEVSIEELIQEVIPQFFGAVTATLIHTQCEERVTERERSEEAVDMLLDAIQYAIRFVRNPPSELL